MIDLKPNSSIDLKKEGKSFFWESFFLPKSYKKNAGTLYSICRYFDDIADKNNEDKTNYLKDSIKEIKNNKNNKINILGNSISFRGINLDKKNYYIAFKK